MQFFLQNRIAETWIYIFLQLSKSIRSPPFLFALYLDIFIDIVVVFLTLHSVDTSIKSLNLRENWIFVFVLGSYESLEGLER